MDRGLCFATGLPLHLAAPAVSASPPRRRPRTQWRQSGNVKYLPKAVNESRFEDGYPNLASDNELTTLLEWCTERGIVLHSTQVLSRDGQRGLYAQEDIKSGDPVVSIPRKAAIIADIADKEPPPFHVLGRLAQSFWESATWEVRLAVVLLDECARGSSSPFYPYISALPKDPWCALWAYETLGRATVSKQLQPYRLHDVANVYRDHVKHTFVSLRKALPKEKRSLVSLESFSWAIAICQSRGFGIPLEGPIANQSSLNKVPPSLPRSKLMEKVPARYALFPGLDMANHSVHCQTSFRYDADNDTYKIHTGSNFSTGQQVFLSYGSKSNDDLMFFYSFVEGNNPANTVKIVDLREWILDMAHADDQDAAGWDGKLDVLQRNHLTHADKSFVFQLDKVPDELMLAIRVAVASTKDVTKFVEEMETQPNQRYKPISLENELNAWHAIDKKCQELLDEEGDFSEEEQESLTSMFKQHPCSAVWRWGEEGSMGELMYRYERQTVLSATQERVRHFAHISSSVGRVCTVLIPPSQSLLKTDLFSGMEHVETTGIHRFAITPEDLQFSS